MSIGVAEGEAGYQFYRIADAIRLPSGRLVVANAGTGELRLYGERGKLLRSSGEAGNGPGEFESLAWVSQLGTDSLLVWDLSLARLSKFDSKLEFLTTISLAAEALESPRLIGSWADGELLAARQLNGVRTSEGLVRDTMEYALLDPTGKLVSPVGTFPGREHFSRVSQRNGKANITGIAVPFGRRTSVALVPSGFYLGTGESFEITLYSREGEILRVLRRPIPNRPVTERMKLDWVENLSDFSATGNVRRLQERMLETLPFPDSLPAYRDILADVDGNVWVREYDVSGTEASVWHVFDSDGEWLGPVAMPASLLPTQIGSDFVVGIWEDELEIEHVHVYDLLKH